jgi:monoamine oxidase
MLNYWGARDFKRITVVGAGMLGLVAAYEFDTISRPA